MQLNTAGTVERGLKKRQFKNSSKKSSKKIIKEIRQRNVSKKWVKKWVKKIHQKNSSKQFVKIFVKLSNTKNSSNNLSKNSSKNLSKNSSKYLSNKVTLKIHQNIRQTTKKIRPWGKWPFFWGFFEVLQISVGLKIKILEMCLCRWPTRPYFLTICPYFFLYFCAEIITIFSLQF